METGALFDRSGGRKYVCAGERARFLAAAAEAEIATRLFCELLLYSGCRISEALAVTPERLDSAAGLVVFQTLKRRRRVFRAVPLPMALLAGLQQRAAGSPADAPLWPWCRVTAWRHVKQVMDAAGIDGPQASPKGLRHGFGIANAEANVPPAITQRWLGHARLETTAIYQHAVGQEERAFAERVWRAVQS